MRKVITYGTYDVLHEGHIRLLKRAKQLGDYLIVGVTGDGFDWTRGKINVQQSLMERIENVRQTGLADQIIVEEYEGQKIDDIKRYNVDIFTVGSDWEGKFDYLNEFCKVVYLPRTEGISSTDLRSEKRELRIGLVGESTILNKFVSESKYVNGVKITGICSRNIEFLSEGIRNLPCITSEFDCLLLECDAVYVISSPETHASLIREALNHDKHVLCESPIALTVEEYDNLMQLAHDRNLILMDGIKTAYSTAFSRMILLVKSGAIGDVISVDATCTRLLSIPEAEIKANPHVVNAMCEWGPTAMLPIFEILGIDYTNKEITSRIAIGTQNFDVFSKVAFVYPSAVASIKIGQGVKSEGQLIISGSKGYVYVPAPWWKTDYFEIRYENQSDNRRFFYQLEGEGIRYEILSFVKSIENGSCTSSIPEYISRGIIRIIEDFYNSNRAQI